MRFILYLLLVLLTFPDVSTAAQKDALLNPDSQVGSKSASEGGDKQTDPPRAQPPTFPDLSEVSPKASELKQKADETREIISTSTKILSRNKEIDEAEARQQKLREMILKISNSDNWDATQISDANIVVLKEKR